MKAAWKALVIASVLGATGAMAQSYTYEPSQSAMPKPDLKGVTVQVGGGIEGYTGKYNSNGINPGPGWDAIVNLKPFKAMGLELGYSGSANELDDSLSPGEGPANGADIVRNGGHAAVILQTPTAVAPYVMGGIGLDRYTFRGVNGQLGYRDDTSGAVPVGVGVRATSGHFNADLRLKYDMLFSDQFSPVRDNSVFSGRYAGVLNVGGSF